MGGQIMKRSFRYTAAATTASVLTASAAGAVSFSRADANGDGVVTYQEAKRVFHGMSEVHYRKADTNGDGVVDQREFPLLNNMYDMLYRNNR